MDNDIAIRVDHVSKTFRLPHEKNTSVKGAVVNFYKRNRTYEKLEALNDITFEVKKGEFFGIVGRNGSGKSTLLKLLAGIYSPSQGNIQVNGKLTPFIELGVGFNPELTGRENIYLNGALLGFNRKEMQKMYKDIVSFAELHKFMDQKLKNYSSGMLVRLAFSIAIRAKSDILLLDEVLAVGDEAFQAKCFQYFDELKRQSKTVVLVTHDMSAFEKYCDQGILVDSSKIKFSGSPLLLSAEYKMLNSIKERPANPAVELSFDKSISAVTVNGEDTVVLSDKGNLDIEIDITSQTATVAAAGISILRSNGTYVAFHNTRGILKDLKLNKGKSARLQYRLPSDQLIPGAYMIDVALYGRDNNYIDLKNGAGKFVIEGKDKTRAGPAKLQGQWTVK